LREPAGEVADAPVVLLRGAFFVQRGPAVPGRQDARAADAPSIQGCRYGRVISRLHMQVDAEQAHSVLPKTALLRWRLAEGIAHKARRLVLGRGTHPPLAFRCSLDAWAPRKVAA